MITRYFFKELPDAPKGVVTSNVAFDWSKLTEDKLYAVLKWYYDFAARTRCSSAKFQIMHEAVGEFQMYVQTATFATRAATMRGFTTARSKTSCSTSAVT